MDLEKILNTLQTDEGETLNARKNKLMALIGYIYDNDVRNKTDDMNLVFSNSETPEDGVINLFGLAATSHMNPGKVVMYIMMGPPMPEINPPTEDNPFGWATVEEFEDLSSRLTTIIEDPANKTSFEQLLAIGKTGDWKLLGLAAMSTFGDQD